jgi:hypothetical protein
MVIARFVHDVLGSLNVELKLKQKFRRTKKQTWLNLA